MLSSTCGTAGRGGGFDGFGGGIEDRTGAGFAGLGGGSNDFDVGFVTK